MPFLQQGATASVTTTAANQFVRVGAFRGASAQVLIPQGLPGGPVTTITDTTVNLGPYPAGTVLQVLSLVGDIEYVTGGTSPALTDGPLNANLPALFYGISLQGGQGAGIACAMTDISGTPGSGTVNAARGRAAFAAGTNSVTITSSVGISANTAAFVQLRVNDATLTSVAVISGVGSFTVTGNANATGVTPFDFLIIR